MILDNRRISIREVAGDVLGMKHAAGKIVPKLQNFEQKTRSLGYRSGDVDDVQR